ncbi:dTDP-4-dehydrorhamnose 3,5-epimerase [Alishewanella longhuensis]|uniref:dTDP-4-dehydrorhamnose 3,5-epimerase n=1 Tax=Alishewanella longhuensis TaxID=1091037 RepID=A0ABQ3KXE2_9ALTE|nr:dTDP-4-dehydrorhamnose 3,5-epimerase [Alishewanella longhuensis]GHG67927.1 dTDP-4-dehydrorhamnose 3,5-epimerase [Alishewanella longhuensis]
MTFIATTIPDVKLKTPLVHKDQRGFFYEAFRAHDFKQQCGSYTFKQLNRSSSVKGVLRGLHFQHLAAQGKLLSVLVGTIVDVVVDLRPTSATFGQVLTLTLDATQHQQLWIPPGFAHGFFVLSDTAFIEYQCTEYFDPNDQYVIRWDDPSLAINWSLDKTDPVVSPKDEKGMSWQCFLDKFVDKTIV